MVETIEIKDNPIVLMEEISRYMGIDDTSWRNIPSHLKKIVNPSSKKQLSDHVKIALGNMYRSPIMEMEEYFGKDLSHWLDGKE